MADRPPDELRRYLLLVYRLSADRTSIDDAQARAMIRTALQGLIDRDEPMRSQLAWERDHALPTLEGAS